MKIRKFIISAFLMLMPSLIFAQFEDAYQELIDAGNPKFNDRYELVLYNASDYILKNSFKPNDKQFGYAAKIVSFWANKETWFGIPLLPNFQSTLKANQNMGFINVVSIVNYILDQKINHNKYLRCIPVKGEKYLENKEVREVIVQGAKKAIQYIIDNKIPSGPELSVFVTAYKENRLEGELFKI